MMMCIINISLTVGVQQVTWVLDDEQTLLVLREGILYAVCVDRYAIYGVLEAHVSYHDHLIQEIHSRLLLYRS